MTLGTETPGFLASLEWKPTGTEAAWVTIGQTGDITGANPTRNMNEVSHRGLTDYFMNYTPGMTDPGELTVVLVLDAPGQDTHGTGGDGLYPSMTTSGCDIPKFKYNINPCSGVYYWIFEAHVQSFPLGDAPIEGHVTGELTVKLTGQPVLYTA